MTAHTGETRNEYNILVGKTIWNVAKQKAYKGVVK